MSPGKPGVWAPEEFFDVPRYLDELRKRKFKVRLRTEQIH
jgi:hypothetical protein